MWRDVGRGAVGNIGIGGSTDDGSDDARRHRENQDDSNDKPKIRRQRHRRRRFRGVREAVVGVDWEGKIPEGKDPKGDSEGRDYKGSHKGIDPEGGRAVQDSKEQEGEGEKGPEKVEETEENAGINCTSQSVRGKRWIPMGRSNERDLGNSRTRLGNGCGAMELGAKHEIRP